MVIIPDKILECEFVPLNKQDTRWFLAQSPVSRFKLGCHFCGGTKYYSSILFKKLKRMLINIYVIQKKQENFNTTASTRKLQATQPSGWACVMYAQVCSLSYFSYFCLRPFFFSISGLGFGLPLFVMLWLAGNIWMLLVLALAFINFICVHT